MVKMSNGSILFPDIPKQLSETYELIKKITTDFRNLKRALSNKERKKLLSNLRSGLNTINLICIKIIAESEASTNANRKMNISFEERAEIVADILHLAEKGINNLVDTDAMNNFLKDYPKLAKKVFLKMYGEREDYLPMDIYESEEEFLGWIYRVNVYIEDVLNTLDETVKKL